MKKCVIFDMDGVIIDSEPIHIRLDQKMFETLGIEVQPETLEQYIGCTNQHMWKDLIEKYQLTMTLEALLKWSLELKIKNLKEEAIEPIEGIRPLLKEIKNKQLLLAVASSSPELYIHTVLEKFHIKEFFDVIVSGEHVKNSKPAPDIFLKAAELLEVKPSDCVVIEDSTHGVSAAKNADMTCIGFDNINSINQDISPADYKVKGIHEIVDAFEVMILGS